MFEWTSQQEKWYKKGAYMNCGKQNHYAKNCRKGQSIKAMKGMTNLKPNNFRQSEELKRTKVYIVKHFAFYYNNKCPVYEKIKYGASYWL